MGKNSFNYARHLNGFSMLEVLIAIVVFAVGLLAIASLQGELIRSGSDSKARSVASNLAEQKLEDLRAFDEGTDFTAIGNETEVHTVSGVNFSLSTSVQPYHYQQAGSTLEEGASATGRVDAKRIAVSVSWCSADSGATCDPTNKDTDPESVVVQDLISSTPPAGSARTLISMNPGIPPQPLYLPGEAPEVIAVNLEDGTQKESPEPEIETTRKPSEDSEEVGVNTITRFEAITYTPPPDPNTDPEGTTVRRQEFLATNCTCSMNGSGSARTPVYWNGAEYVGGDMVTKPVGSSTLGNSETDFLQQLCSDCCRDHHDVPGKSITYDHDSSSDTPDLLSRLNPFLTDASGASVEHQHYLPDQNDELQVSTGDYLEACRFTRVDGQLVITNDFRLESLQTLPGTKCTSWDAGAKECADGASVDVSSGWVDSYRNYVTDFVKGYVNAVDGNYPMLPPNRGTPNLADNLAATYVLPTSDTSPYIAGVENSDWGESRELVSRAIFMDYLSPELLNRIACRQGNGTNCSDRDASGDPILPLIPFYEVNLQLQANWATDENNLVEVISQPVDNAGYTRGNVERLSSSGATTEVFATIEQGNVGLTDTHDVHPIDADGSGTVDRDEFFQDSITYSSAASGTDRPLVKGSVNVEEQAKKNQLQPSDLVVTDQFGASCNSTQGDEFFECELLEADASGSITVTNYSQIQGNSLVDNKVCLFDGTTWYAGTVNNDTTVNDTTVFDFEALDPPADRTGYELKVLSQSGGSISCSPGQVK